MQSPDEEQRLKDVRKTFDVMWNAVVAIHASYDSICFAAAMVIAEAIIQAPRDQGVTQEDALMAVEKHIREMLRLNKEQPLQ
jgi:hypothetical protein